MEGIISGLKNGATSYFTKSHFTNINDLIKSKSLFGSSGEEYNEMLMDSSSDVKMAFMLSNLFIVIMIIASTVLGFMAVTRMCRDQTERGKNTRLGLYGLLVLTGGQIGWIYILLWIFKIDICT
jgi:hypothetical protein